MNSLNPIEIQNYFKEFSNIKEKCKYKNCLHYQEPTAACTIKQAVENNTINKNVQRNTSQQTQIYQSIANYI